MEGGEIRTQSANTIEAQHMHTRISMYSPTGLGVVGIILQYRLRRQDVFKG
eukprot:COSAG01_NODE_16396_length_1239_cov_5.273684_2_plen_50_part_01